MDNFISSIQQWFSDKKTSPFYGAFLIGLITWNWKFFYALFFLSLPLNSFEINKLTYIENNFLSGGASAHLVNFFLAPLMVGLISIYVLPHFTLWIGNTYFKSNNKKKLQRKEFDIAYTKQETELLKEENDAIQAKNEVVDLISENLSDSDRWENEFMNFKKTSLFPLFPELMTLVYDVNGKRNAMNISTDIYAFADSAQLIKIESDGFEGDQVRLTDKGKYFVKLFLDNKNKEPLF